MAAEININFIFKLFTRSCATARLQPSSGAKREKFSSSRKVVFNLGVATPEGFVCLFSRAARASHKNIHNYFYILYFLYGTTFCRSQNNRIAWQKC